MSAPGFVLILTKGTHVVGVTAIEKIQRAIDAGDKLVTIDLDLFGNVDPSRQTTIATAHVVAWAQNPKSIADLGNVAMLHRRRRA